MECSTLNVQFSEKYMRKEAKNWTDPFFFFVAGNRHSWEKFLRYTAGLHTGERPRVHWKSPGVRLYFSFYDGEYCCSRYNLHLFCSPFALAI